MTEREFYDRKEELAMLKEKYTNLRRGELCILYGRRRVGKTELIRQFLKTLPENKLYFYVDLTSKRGILNSLSDSVLEQLKETIKFSDFGDFLSYIESKSDVDKFVFVIDEFQRFLYIAPEFITQLQNNWDTKLKHKNILLILVGSSIGMIQKVINSRAGALYGRGTRVKISPFKYSDFRLMFKELSEEEKVITYAVFGGTPYYLDKVKRADGDIYQKILDLVLKRGAQLYEEPKNLLEYENVRVHAKYNAILHATSSGKETLKEINDFTKIDTTVMPAYINKLDELLDLLGKNDPILGKERLGRYCVRDNFFRFWYRFVFPNQTALNLGNTRLVHDIIKRDLNGYVGRVFEGIAKELIISNLNKKIKGIELNFEDIGSWWDRNGNEIDIIAYNEKSKKILLGEVKWTSNKLDLDIVNELLRKSKLINFNGEYQFLFISKSGFTDKAITKIEEIKGVYLDLKELSELFDRLN